MATKSRKKALSGWSAFSVSIIMTLGFIATPSNAADLLPTVRIISPELDAKNDTFTNDQMAQWYAVGGRSFYKYVGAGSTITITYLVTTDGKTPAAGKDIDFMVNAAYSGSKAKWEIDGKAVGASQDNGTGYGSLVAAKTDADGKVSFTIKNTDDAASAEALPTSENQPRPATRLYGVIKTVIHGLTDMQQIIDQVAFDITKAPATVLPATAAVTPTPAATPTPTPVATPTPTPTASATETPMVISAPLAKQSVATVASSVIVGKSITLPAKSSSGIVIKWVSNTKTTCTISSNKLTGKKKGSCSVTGTNAGDSKNLALSITKKITIK